MKQNYVLDTCICVFVLRGKYGVASILDELDNTCCYISEVTLAELKYGIECSNDRENGLKQLSSFVTEINVIPFEAAIDTFSKEKARLRRNGTPIDDFDLLIGATAKALNMTLVTDNIWQVSDKYWNLPFLFSFSWNMSILYVFLHKIYCLWN